MDQGFAEEFKCPICLEIPQKHMFQCKDGHMVCGECIPTLVKCPQCRLPYGNEKIRCRLLESLLDNFKFECDYKELGCAEKISRSKLLDHLSTCKFSPNGGIHLCKLIGFSECDYLFSKMHVSEGLAHFRNEHEFIQQDTHFLNMRLENLENVTGNCMWTPVILGKEDIDKGSPFRLLIFATIHEEASISWTILDLMSIQLAKGEFQIQFQIERNDHKEKIPELSWRQIPVKVEALEEYLKMAPFRIPIRSLKENYMKEGSLIVKVDLMTCTGFPPRPPILEEIWLFPISISGNPREFTTATENTVPVPVPAVTEESSRREIFEGITCGNCKTTPLIGKRFKCLQCEDYDLCEKCMRNRGENPEHVFALIQTREQSSVFNQLRGSSGVILVGEQVFFPEQSRAMYMRESASTVFPDGRCSECATSPLIKTKYKCFQCAASDFCESCVERGCHSEHVLIVITNHYQNMFVASVTGESI